MNQQSTFKKIQSDFLSVKTVYFTAKPNGSTRLHLHPNTWHIVYVLRGRGTCLVDGQKHPLKPGFIHIVYPNEIHQYRADPTHPYTVYFLHIECGGSIPKVFPRQISSKHLRQDSVKTFRKLVKLQHETSQKKQSILSQAIFGVLIADLMKIPTTTPSKTIRPAPILASPLLNDVLLRLRTPPFEYPGIDSLASQLNMSRRNFTQYFRKLTGMSVKKYFLNYRLTHAHMLKEMGDLRNKEIALQCGYSNSQNLVRACRKANHST